jgi:hypothetical protein
MNAQRSNLSWYRCGWLHSKFQGCRNAIDGTEQPLHRQKAALNFYYGKLTLKSSVQVFFATAQI